MKNVIFLFALLLAVLSLRSQDIRLRQIVKGKVIDEQSGNVLRDVTVIVEGISPRIGSITDSLGTFRLANVLIGRKTIRASFVGYEEAIIRNIEVTSSKEVV